MWSKLMMVTISPRRTLARRALSLVQVVLLQEIDVVSLVPGEHPGGGAVFGVTHCPRR